MELGEGCSLGIFSRGKKSGVDRKKTVGDLLSFMQFESIRNRFPNF